METCIWTIVEQLDASGIYLSQTQDSMKSWEVCTNVTEKEEIVIKWEKLGIGLVSKELAWMSLLNFHKYA